MSVNVHLELRSPDELRAFAKYLETMADAGGIKNPYEPQSVSHMGEVEEDYDNDDNEEDDNDQSEPKKKKTRTRRTKAQIEADNAAAAKAEEESTSPEDEESEPDVIEDSSEEIEVEPFVAPAIAPRQIFPVQGSSAPAITNQEKPEEDSPPKVAGKSLFGNLVNPNSGS